MTEMPEFFEVQGRDAASAHWDTKISGLTHEQAMVHGEAFRQHNKGERYRVVPFGTGPTDAEPIGTDPSCAVERQAWDMLAERVRRRGGRTDDIVRHAAGFRYYTGDPAAPVLGAGWESGTVTPEGFRTDQDAPTTTDVTASGGC